MYESGTIVMKNIDYLYLKSKTILTTMGKRCYN